MVSLPISFFSVCKIFIPEAFLNSPSSSPCCSWVTASFRSIRKGRSCGSVLVLINIPAVQFLVGLICFLKGPRTVADSGLYDRSTSISHLSLSQRRVRALRASKHQARAHTVVKPLGEYKWWLPVTPISISSSTATSFMRVILAGRSAGNEFTQQ